MFYRILIFQPLPKSLHLYFRKYYFEYFQNLVSSWQLCQLPQVVATPQQNDEMPKSPKQRYIEGASMLMHCYRIPHRISVPKTFKRKGVSVALWTDRCWCSQCHQNLNSKQWKRGVKNRCIPVCLQHFFGPSPQSFLLVLDWFFGPFVIEEFLGECFCFAISFCA